MVYFHRTWKKCNLLNAFLSVSHCCTASGSLYTVYEFIHMQFKCALASIQLWWIRAAVQWLPSDLSIDGPFYLFQFLILAQHLLHRLITNKNKIVTSTMDNSSPDHERASSLIFFEILLLSSAPRPSLFVHTCFVSPLLRSPI